MSASALLPVADGPDNFYLQRVLLVGAIFYPFLEQSCGGRPVPALGKRRRGNTLAGAAGRGLEARHILLALRTRTAKGSKRMPPVNEEVMRWGEARSRSALSQSAVQLACFLFERWRSEGEFVLDEQNRMTAVSVRGPACIAGCPFVGSHRVNLAARQ